MATVKETLAAAVAVNCTLASLGATSTRESDSVDNSTSLYLDILVVVTLKSNGVSANDRLTYIYAAGSIDGGASWPDAITGADAAVTLPANGEHNLRLLGVINWQAAGTAARTARSQPLSVAAAFGGVIPSKVNFIIQNSNATLTATASDHSIKIQGVTEQVG